MLEVFIGAFVGALIGWVVMVILMLFDMNRTDGPLGPEAYLAGPIFASFIAAGALMGLFLA